MVRRLVAACAVAALAACGMVPGARSADDAMSLLRDGSAKVCTSAEVRDTLRGMILPKAVSLADFDLPADDKKAAIDGIAVRLSDVTLDAFDKGVSKATCNATVTLQQGGEEIGDAQALNFTVAPSAADETTFVISAGLSGLRLAARGAVVATLGAQQARRATETADAKAAADRQDLANMVSRGWLIGRWVSADAQEGGCVDGPYDEYRRDGSYQGYESVGRWSLAGLDLTVSGEDEGEPFNTTTTITAAEADRFSERRGNEAASTMRRCGRAEMTPAEPQDTPM